MAPPRPASGACSGRRLPMLLALLALFSLALLGSWHDMHPDLGPFAHAPTIERAFTGDATGHPDYLDHVASHAGLHAIGLPAFPTATAAPIRVSLRWHAGSQGLLTSIDPARTLRPPRI